MGKLSPPQSKVLYILVSCTTGNQLSFPSTQQQMITDFISRALQGQYTMGTLYLVKESSKRWAIREKRPANIKLQKQFLPHDLVHLADV